MPDTQAAAESHLRGILQQDAHDWETRKKLAQLLYNEGKTKEAAECIWDAPEIPSIDLELGFAIKVLGKGAPRRAIRLLSTIQELNEGKPVQNLGLANALMHYGMVMLAARFYGAAIAASQEFASSDLEYFLLWTDDTEKIWGDFKEIKPSLAELPWMKRSAKEAEQLKKAMQGHTTPIKIPNLEEVTAEMVVHDMYVQSSRVASDPTPPPAVTIPIDRVNPKDVIVDPARGAGSPVTAEQAQQSAPAVGTGSGIALPANPLPASPQPASPPTPATVADAKPTLPQPAPTQMIISGAPRPGAIPTQSLASSGAPTIKLQAAPSPSLVDGKIVVKPRTMTDDKDKAKDGSA